MGTSASRSVISSDSMQEGMRMDNSERRSIHNFFYQAEDGIRDVAVTGVQTCALPISALFLGAAGFAAKAALEARKTPAIAPARIDGAETLAPNSALNFHYPTEKDSAILVRDRKSTRLNSSHGYISYAVFCLKKKT